MKRQNTLATIAVATLYTFTAYSQQNNDSLPLVTIPDVVVLEKVSAPEQISLPVSIIRTETIEESTEASLLPVLKNNVPGLFLNSQGVAGYGVSSGASGNITMRGFSGSAGRILILIDGHPQYAPIYGHPMADTYTTDNVERVEVAHGASSVLYGSNAMAGSINFITREPKDNDNKLRLRAKFGSYGTTHYMISNSFRKNKLAVFASGNYEQSDGYRENSEFSSVNGFGKIAYSINEHWKVYGNATINHFDIEMPGSVTDPVNECEANITRGIYEISLANTYKKIDGSTIVYYNWGQHQINDGYKEGGKPQEYLFHSTDYMGGVNARQGVSLFSGNTITIGCDIKLYGGNAYRNPETERYADHISFNETAGYLIVNQKIKNFSCNAGLRAENHSLYGMVLVPQVGLSYGTKHSASYKCSYSKGFRTPNMRELYMYAPANEELMPENSHSFDISYNQFFFNKKLYAELNLYHILGKNIIQTTMVNGLPKNMNTGEFANTGVEFATYYNINNNIRLNGDYSYVHMETPIISSPRQKTGIHAQFKENKVNVTVGVQYIDKLYVAVGKTETTKSFALVDARISYKASKMITAFAMCENTICSGTYETLLGYPLPKLMVHGGCTIDLQNKTNCK